MSATEPLVGVLALQGDVREHVRALAAAGARGVPVRRPGELDGLDGIVLPGGESTTMGKLAEAFGLVEPLRAAIKDGLPAFGSCAGMILLADRILDGRPDQQTLGGMDVVVRRNAFGRQVDSFEGEVEVEGLVGGPVEAVFIRAPWVESVGPGVQVLARLGHEVHSISTGEGPGESASRIVAVREAALLATAFHPELTGDARVHAMFVAMVKGQS
ncbi:MAG: pyridoxal 5'-phosphate synthase glutaminase subunit PdxT [Actinomycetes bacterium]